MPRWRFGNIFNLSSHKIARETAARQPAMASQILISDLNKEHHHNGQAAFSVDILLNRTEALWGDVGQFATGRANVGASELLQNCMVCEIYDVHIFF